MNLTETRDKMTALEQELRKRIFGMDDVIKFLFVCLFSAPGRNCHILLEGVPGLAKTLLFKTLAEASDASFRRISFAADLLPKDVVGIEDFDRETGRVRLLVQGPLFCNFLVADELNRARTTSKGSILEPMEEGQVTTELGGTYNLEDPFMVMATQNPVEQEGVFPLGRAEQDRFLMKVLVGYPSPEEEEQIIVFYGRQDIAAVEQVISGSDIVAAREAIVRDVRVDPILLAKARNIVRETRPESSGIQIVRDLVEIPSGGASPRAGIHLVRASRVHALYGGRDYVTPEDFSAIALPILRHRVVFRPGEVEESETENTLQQIIGAIFDKVFGDE